MPKQSKAMQKLAEISPIGNATRGVGAGSRSSGLPSGWTVKVVQLVPKKDDSFYEED